MSQFPFYALAFAGVLGVLIVVHELGHYLAARFCGVKVLRFSVGFGRPLWQRTVGQDKTEWVLAAFPLGGYVKMLDEREGVVSDHEKLRAFNRQSVGKRSLIVAAGPMANLLAAVLIYWVVYFVGSHELLPVLGEPVAASPAARAGLRHGDQVLCVDGESVDTFSDFRWQLLSAASGKNAVMLEIVNEQREHHVIPLELAVVRESGWEGDPLDHLGVRLYRPLFPAVVGKVIPESVGALAGLLPLDKIVAVNGAPVVFWHEFVQLVRESPGRVMTLEIERAQSRLTLQLVPEASSSQGKMIGKVGISVDDDGRVRRELQTFVRYGVLDSASRAIRETWDKSLFSLQMIGKMLFGEVSWRNLSGPVTIADYAGQSAKMGLDYYLKFMALVSISLGVLNLLPIPVLDGGHLMYHAIEVVRRRPLSERTMEKAQQVGLFLLVVMMAFAFFNDITRIVAN